MRYLRSLLIVAVLTAAPHPTAFAGDTAEVTKAVWAQHVARATAGDIDAVMEDFSDDSVMVTPRGSLEGKTAIRGFFEEFLAGFTPEIAESTVVNSETVHGKVVVFNFTIGAAGRTFHDTALIEDGKIKVLATVDYPAE